MSEWLESEPPVIRFHNGQQLVRELLFSEPEVARPFLADQIEVWDWTGTDLSREAQGLAKDPTSIQCHVMSRFFSRTTTSFSMTMGRTRRPDVVAVRADDERVTVRLYHCEGVPDGRVRSRVEDVYEVCGQAQRSVHWKGDRERLLDHLGRRAARAQARGRVRIEKGDAASLAAIARRIRLLDVDFEIAVVQPGMTRAGLTDGQRDLLATTQLYLVETFAVPLRIIANA